MLLKTDRVQIRFVAAGEDAAEHLSRHFVRMSAQVLLKVAPGAKRLVAIIAFERFFSRVHFLVPPKVRDLRERLSTPFFLAGVGFKVIMNSLVLIERRHLHESLLADLASELSIYFVSPFVFIQCLLRVKYLFTLDFFAIEEHICLNPD